MNESIIANRLLLCFYLGLLVGLGIGFHSVPEPKTPNINIQIRKDTVLSKQVSVLNEKTLREELVKNNIPHKDIVLAQAKLESAHFKSSLVHTNQNIFGLKRGNKYRKYSHWTECVKDYKKCISDRYTGGNYYTFLTRIGYSENKDYIDILKDMV